ncbi:MAG: TldD/PmbA family protein [Candidatus Diapherotrites archaeon]|nr:TldD/PmbA family protein [Candidatus Diapherotrites archaeon]
MDYIKIAANVLDNLNPDYYDIRYSEGNFTAMSTEKSKIKSLSSGKSTGIGIRVVYKGAQSFCSTEIMTKDSISNAAKNAFKLAKSISSKNHFEIDMGKLPQKRIKAKAVGKKLPDAMSLEEKISNILEFSKYGANIDKRIKNADIIYSDSLGSGMFLNSEGTAGEALIQRVRIGSKISAKQGARIEASGDARGAIAGLEYVFNDKIYEIINKNAKESVNLLSAKRPKSGTYDLVLDSEISGTLAHEAIGHATEGDAIVTKESVLCGKLGERLASDIVSLSDDPKLREFGFIGYDSEGMKPKKHNLIVKGALNEYLLDRDSASKLGMKPNGASRAESTAVLPQVRMSNTFFEPGDMTKEEVLEGIKSGYLLSGCVAGTTNVMSGTFNFTSKCCYRIENGEIKEIMLPVVISGDILTTLKNITHVGNKLKFDPGYCTKDGQDVPVSSGGPYMRLIKGQLGGI